MKPFSLFLFYYEFYSIVFFFTYRWRIFTIIILLLGLFVFITWFTKRCTNVAQGHKYGEPNEDPIYFSVVTDLRDKLINRYTTMNCPFLLLPLQFMTRTATVSQPQLAGIKCMKFLIFPSIHVAAIQFSQIILQANYKNP